MKTAAAIALFCAGGGLTRYYLSGWVNRMLGHYPFPFGTLVVNLIGAFFIGLIIEFSLRSTMISPTMRVALTVGFMGGLTTFSTFSIETFTLIERGQLLTALVNILISVTLCLLATWVGIAAARAI